MIEKPKKERRFLKALGRVGEILIEQVLIKVGSSLIKRIGGKKQIPSILFLFLSISLFAQYPSTGNKQRLGYQTTGDGLVWRGRASDTISLKSSTINNAYIIIDTLQNVMYNYIKTKGGWQFSNGDTVIINNNFTQPFDSLFFKTSVSPNNVDTAKMRWDAELGTVVLGMYEKVPNEIGFKNFWLVKNQTGSTIAKNSLVYASGTVGASGRISVSKFIANGTIDAKYLLGITAHDLTDGEDGYVISFGKIRQVNTDTFAAGAILYPSPTTAGVWTDVEPIAPNLDMPIGFCINSHVNNGTIAIRVASGYKLNELHDVQITSPVDRASLYYRGGLWRDTTTALLVSDTSSMLTNYLRSGVAASTFLPLTGGTMTGAINRQEGSHDGSTSTFYYNILNYFAKRDNSKGNQTAQITFTDRPGTSTFENNVRTSDIYLMTAKNFSGGQLGQFLDTTLSVVANQDGGRIGISKLNPAYKLDVNGTFNASGNSLIGGTLGVTGATTLSNLAGSGTRMVTASSTGLLSTQSIPIGTVTGTGTTNYLPIFTGSSSLGNSSIYDNGNIGIGTNNPTVAIDILNSTSAQSAKIRLSTEFASAVRTLTIGSGDGITWDLPGSTSQSPYIDVIGGDNTFGGGNFIIKTQSSNRFTVRQNGNVGINTTTPSFLLDVNGTTGLQGALTVNNATVLNEGSGDFDTRIESDGNANMVFVDAGQDRVGIGTGSPSKTLDINGEVKIATVTATPTALLGKDGSNVVGEVTTVAQTGLMTRGETTATTGSPSAIFTVTHGLGSNPSAVIVTSAGIGGGDKIIFEVYTKSSTTFSVQAWNLDGTEASSKDVKIYWLAIK